MYKKFDYWLNLTTVLLERFERFGAYLSFARFQENRYTRAATRATKTHADPPQCAKANDSPDCTIKATNHDKQINHI